MQGNLAQRSFGESPRQRYCAPWLLMACAAISLCGIDSRTASAQPPAVPWWQQEPFDQITLDAENKNAVLKVELLPFPGRQLPPKPDPESNLGIVLQDQPGDGYNVKWKHIQKVELFELRLLAEAQQQTAAGKLDDAHDMLLHLKQHYPQLGGVDAAVQTYLYTSAGRMFQEQRWPEALAAVEELHKLNPNFAGARSLTDVLAAVLERIVGGYVEKQDYRAARLLLARVRRDYGDKHAVAVTQWESRLSQLAATELGQAREFIAAGKLRDATRASRRMLEIWPEVPGGRELAAEITARYPVAVVAITQPTAKPDRQTIDDWGARRVGGLFPQRMVEFIKPGAEGGQYAFSWGSLQTSEDRRRVSLRLNDAAAAKGVTGYDVARRLLRRATPGDAEFSTTWRNLFAGVAVREVVGVEIDLKRPYVAPEAALQISWPLPLAEELPFALEAGTGNERYFVAKTTSAANAGLAEIRERIYDDPALAIAALERGEVDMIDRVLPADVKRLSANASLTVEPYALPTLHMLLPNYQRPLPANRMVRRAVLYAISRESILREQLLAGSSPAGCVVLAGAFSPGIAENDPLGYAADATLVPRAYDPRLAVTLLGMARRELAKESPIKEQATEPTGLKITLGYPSSEAARIACQAIAAQLTAVGLECTLRPFTPGVVRDDQSQCDFVYAEAVLAEPVIDARRLLGADGVLRSNDPYLELALRRLDESSNWVEARQRLRALDRQVHADVTIIPLWQLTEHFARRKEFVGPTARCFSLYDNIAAWRASGAPAAATTAAAGNR